MKETQSFEGEQGCRVSRHLALGTMGIYTRRNAIWRIFVLLITFSSNDLSSRLLKMEQKKYHRIFFPQISTKWFPLSSLATRNFKFRVWFVKKSFFSYWIGFLFSTSSDCLQRTVMIKTYQINWPLQMSPVARTSFALGSSFQNPGWKTAREIWGTEPARPLI